MLALALASLLAILSAPPAVTQARPLADLPPLSWTCVIDAAQWLLAASAPPSARVASVVNARRGQVYLQVFEDGVAASTPQVLSVDEAARTLDKVARAGPLVMIGAGVALLGDLPETTEVNSRMAPDPVAVARLASLVDGTSTPPRPVYLRAPDARLPA